MNEKILKRRNCTYLKMSNLLFPELIRITLLAPPASIVPLNRMNEREPKIIDRQTNGQFFIKVSALYLL